MCRSIAKLRYPVRRANENELEEAALRNVRKISGFRRPFRANEAVFTQAVEDIAASSQRLLQGLLVREGSILCTLRSRNLISTYDLDCRN